MADLALTHPKMAERCNQLVALCWSRSWYVGITSSTRSYDEQKSLYDAYKNAPSTHNTAANPDASLFTSPAEVGGWPVKGSFHMVQQDGHSHALDLHWSQCSPEELAEAAQQCGLRLTVAGENWHFQWFDQNGVFDNPSAVPTVSEEDEMTPVIHNPSLREGSGIIPVWDFTYLPADTAGQAVFGIVVVSNLYIRRHLGADTLCTVYIQGAPTKYRVPEDGTTMVVPVTHEGLTSVVGDVIVEAREQWRKA